jgi:hypothetical protein
MGPTAGPGRYSLYECRRSAGRLELAAQSACPARLGGVILGNPISWGARRWENGRCGNKLDGTRLGKLGLRGVRGEHK